MAIFQKILVCLPPDAVVERDALPAEAAALCQTAITIAGRSQGTVTFFSVYPLPRVGSSSKPLGLGVDPSELEQQVLKKSAEQLEKFGESFRSGGLTAETKVAAGSPWREILGEAVQGNYDLVMVGTGGHSQLYHAIFGTTAMKLLRFCPAPVFVQRATTATEGIPEVVLSIDVADGQETLLRQGVEAAKMLDARLHVLHAVNPPYANALRISGMTEGQIQDYRDRYRQESEKTIQEWLSQTDHRTLTHGLQLHLIDGPPDQVILRFLQDHAIDLLILGTSGRKGLSGMMIGNTCERLLPEINCSVLAFKPEGFQSPVSVEERPEGTA